MAILFNFFILSLLSLKTWAYPDFISYGYNSCVLCHYNSAGGGAINDYGRALLASEFTARHVFSASKTDDQIGEDSGFIPGQELPWWIRPGIKTRSLWLRQDPGMKTEVDRFINMQSDVNLNVLFTKKQSLGLFTTTSYFENPRRFSTSVEKNKKNFAAREYYVRWQALKNLWVYIGQMDKVFGIRQIDHTYYSRARMGLGQFDQSQGIVLFYTDNKYDLALNVFGGNDAEEDVYKQKGASFFSEYEVGEKSRLGFSILSSKNTFVNWNRYAVHLRQGLTKGTSLLSELGYFQNKDLISQQSKNGIYIVVQTLYSLDRGYNLLSMFQHVKDDVSVPSPDRTQFGLGTLMFPLPRTEVRFLIINSTLNDNNNANKDSWTLQSQLHLSL
jgi:hypothetical protein